MLLCFALSYWFLVHVSTALVTRGLPRAFDWLAVVCCASLLLSWAEPLCCRLPVG